MVPNTLTLCSLMTLLLLPMLATAQTGKTVDFDREVRPILAENCFACHGFDANKRQAGLRLDTQEGANLKLPSGNIAVVSGNLKTSALVQRITAFGPLHMPPRNTGKALTNKQIETLRRWVAQGGKYAQHWAFVLPKRPALPKVKRAGWGRTPIDSFLLARMEQEGLSPSPEADRRTLLRRLSFDLTGLPPTLAEMDAFLADKAPNAYEKQVDRLLASPHYGEKMAVKWLDLARYADTHGYHIDSQRDMWRWRDWVIAAYNRNMPYNQFTIEQIAGDLLPNPTLDQKIATGFNRNHPINYEGGAIPEEYQAAYVFDRVDTTATAFLGLTMRCAQCHDHKYDPLTQKDFYRFFAFFNTISENGLDGMTGNAAPFIKSPLPEQQKQLEEYRQKVASVEQATKTRAAEAASDAATWQKTALASLSDDATLKSGLAGHFAFEETDGAKVQSLPSGQPLGAIHGKAARAAGHSGNALQLDGSNYVEVGNAFGFDRTSKFSYGAWVYPAADENMAVLSRMEDTADTRGYDLFLSDRRVFVHLIHKWESDAIRVNTKAQIELNKWTHLFVTYDGSGKAKGIKVYINGKPADLDTTHDSLKDTIRSEKPFVIGRRNPSAPFKGRIDELRVYDRELAPAEVAQLVGVETLRPLLLLPEEKRTPEQKEAITRYYLENRDEPYRRLAAELTEWRKKTDDLDKSIPTTMIMQEMEKPRETHILVRGQYDHPGEKVTAALPAVFNAALPEPKVNRMTLAKWLVDPANPLTARVAVNRMWQTLFGTGIVKTAENFGTQGEPPSHPELLDWLATEFIRTGWDMKGLIRLIVTSAAYRQSSKVTPTLLERDPENRLLARAPRFRLPAEVVRDQALAVSGLLVEKLGGPSVKPYHPAGLWEEMAFGGGFSAQTYVQDHGENLYRRTMYTFWKRTCPPPSLQTFDAPEREFCVVRRSVTNTPMQALVLMNDPTYVEASRKLAERIMTEGGFYPGERIKFAYLLAMSRPPKPAEAKLLEGLYEAQVVKFRKDKAAAEKLLSVGESPRNPKLNTAELAAWSAVASVLLNLDETITKT